MSRKLFYFIIAFVIALLLAFFVSSSSFPDNWRDSRVWSKMRHDLLTEDIASVVTSQGFSVSGDQVREMRKYIGEARFAHSNRAGRGSTVEAGFVIRLRNGTEIRFNHWGGGTFEVFETTDGRRRYDPDAQFLIVSSRLATWYAQLF